MLKGERLTATAKMERSRQMTKRMAERELMYAVLLSRLWPSYLTAPKRENLEYPLILCVESPAGLLTWRLEPEAVAGWFSGLPKRANSGEVATDRTGVLLALIDCWRP